MRFIFKCLGSAAAIILVLIFIISGMFLNRGMFWALAAAIAGGIIGGILMIRKK